MYVKLGRLSIVNNEIAFILQRWRLNIKWWDNLIIFDGQKASLKKLKTKLNSILLIFFRSFEQNDELFICFSFLKRPIDNKFNFALALLCSQLQLQCHCNLFRFCDKNINNQPTILLLMKHSTNSYPRFSMTLATNILTKISG